jgi:hypothetical protein
MAKQSAFPRDTRGSVKVDTVNGVGRAEAGRVTVASFEPERTTEKLPYRDTVTGRYRERE